MWHGISDLDIGTGYLFAFKRRMVQRSFCQYWKGVICQDRGVKKGVVFWMLWKNISDSNDI